MTTLMTAEELYLLPESAERWELVRGELRRMAPGNPAHGYRANNAAYLLTAYARDHGLGHVYTADTGFILARRPDTVRAPDVAFVRAERIPPEGEPETSFWAIAPDLAVEVVSPSESKKDMEEKVADYLGAGTRLVWALHGRTRTATVYRPGRRPQPLTEDDQLDGEDVLPGFSCRVGDLL